MYCMYYITRFSIAEVASEKFHYANQIVININTKFDYIHIYVYGDLLYLFSSYDIFKIYVHYHDG